MGKLFDKTWQEMKNITCITGYTLFTPLWNHSSYGELMKLEAFDLWAFKGLRYIAQLFQNDVLKTFNQLSNEYGIPNQSFFPIPTAQACYTGAGLIIP